MTIGNGYVRKEVPLLVAHIYAVRAWSGLTRIQRAGLLGPTRAQPNTLTSLRTRGMLDDDNTPTSWGELVASYEPFSKAKAAIR